MNSPTHNLRALLIVLLSTTFEFYNFSLFAINLNLFSNTFFSLNNEFYSTLISITIYSTSYTLRPVGAIIFGKIADRLGRAKALSYSMIIMSLCTFLMGVLPTYKSVGVLAPILLLLCRIGQILCVGGAYTNALIYMVENFKHNRHKTFGCSLITALTMLGWSSGAILGSLFNSVTSWRIPFLISGIGFIIGLYFRKHVQDSIEIMNLLVKSSCKTNLLNHNNKQAKKYVFGILVGLTIGILFYTYLVFLNTFIPLVTTITSTEAKIIVTTGSISYMVWLVIIGCIADVIGYRRCLNISAFTQILLGFSLNHAFNIQSYKLLLIIEVFAGLSIALFVVPSVYKLTLKFYTQIRGASVSLSYGLGIAIGGFAPVVLMYIFQLVGQAFMAFSVTASASILIILIGKMICKP